MTNTTGAPGTSEIVVISGKGGTGKTSIVASFAMLERNVVVADCDVDAADLHLVLSPQVRHTQQFFSGRVARIEKDLCIACGECVSHCRFEAVQTNGADGGISPYFIDSVSCEGCGVCVYFCPQEAIAFPERHCGELFVSEARSGAMVHARLGIAAGNSGKLVANVRSEAKKLAAREGKSLILIDGPPGVGCPVIASVTGTSMALLVTEPTLSGEHDLVRVLELTKHFRVPTAVCVNKWDMNPEMADLIEKRTIEHGAVFAGRVSYNEDVTTAQLQAKTVVELGGEAAAEIKAVWGAVRDVGVTHGIRL